MCVVNHVLLLAIKGHRVIWQFGTLFITTPPMSNFTSSKQSFKLQGRHFYPPLMLITHRRLSRWAVNAHANAKNGRSRQDYRRYRSCVCLLQRRIAFLLLSVTKAMALLVHHLDIYRRLGDRSLSSLKCIGDRPRS